MTKTEKIETRPGSRKRVLDGHRTDHTADMINLHFPLHLDPYIYRVASELLADFRGDQLEFSALCDVGVATNVSWEQIND